MAEKELGRGVHLSEQGVHRSEQYGSDIIGACIKLLHVKLEKAITCIKSFGKSKGQDQSRKLTVP